MEIEKLGDFLKSCCRVCLSVNNEMVDSSNIVESFNKTIDQLLFECANLKMSSGNTNSGNPRKLCENCTAELVMVAEFREKCAMSAVALDQLRRQMNRINKVEEFEEVHVQADLENDKELEPNSEPLYENIEYSEENVEYVIYDTSADLIEETDSSEKPEDTVQSDANDDDSLDGNTDDKTNAVERASSTGKVGGSRKTAATSKRVKRIEEMAKQNQKTVDSAIKFHCKICGAGFAQMNNLTKHLQAHRDYDKESEDKDEHENPMKPADSNCSTTNPTIQPAKVRKQLQKSHSCQYCSRAFPSLSLLVTHTRIHTGERPYECSICAKTFKTKGALDLHVRRHNGVKPYKCTFCNRGFVESSNLKVHMRTHTGEKPHSCVTCGRSFSRVFLLQIHQRTHTGEKPFQCDTCDKSFAQQGDLAAHKRIHSGERPHRCKVCHKGFIKSSGLTQHMRRHYRPTSTVKGNNATDADADADADADTEPEIEADGDVLQEDDPIELINIEENMEIDSKTEKIMICYKEYNENSQSFDDYLENC